jgi:predicted nucleic acid-binding Zn ribbon protein
MTRLRAERGLSLDDLYDPADWCRWCGGRLPQDAYWGRRKYCSADCFAEHEWARQGKRRADIIAERRCQWCGGAIDESRHIDAKFCSRRCNQAHHKHLRGEARAATRAAKACQVCGASLDHLSRSDARYCSRKCHSRAERMRKAQRRQSQMHKTVHKIG